MSGRISLNRSAELAHRCLGTASLRPEVDCKETDHQHKSGRQTDYHRHQPVFSGRFRVAAVRFIRIIGSIVVILTDFTVHIIFDLFFVHDIPLISQCFHLIIILKKSGEINSQLAKSGILSGSFPLFHPEWGYNRNGRNPQRCNLRENYFFHRPNPKNS